MDMDTKNMAVIDIHNHALCGIDDGAKDIATTKAIIQQLKDQGVSRIVFTPHYYTDDISLEDFITKRDSIFDSIKDDLDTSIEYLLGAEIYITKFLFLEKNFDLLEKVSFNNNVLIELPLDTKIFQNVPEWIEKIMNKGFQPIIAHFERVIHIKGGRELVHYLKQRGVLLQCNAQTVINKRTFSKIKDYFKNNDVDYIATDAHNIKERPPVLLESFEIIRKKYGDDIANKLMFATI